MTKKIVSISLILTIILSISSSLFAIAAQDNDNARHSTFEYPLYGDPYHMSDEDFFGQWDPQAGFWRTHGVFDYDKHPGLSGVEGAVKRVENGDYEEAKRELLEYYRSISSQRVAPVMNTQKVIT